MRKMFFLILCCLLLVGCRQVDEKNIPTYQEKQLVKAAWSGDKETIVKLLSSNKVNVDARNEYGTTALMAVSQNGHADLVELLVIKYGADVNIENHYGRTALMLADYGSFDTMEILLSNGANVDAKNNVSGSTTLMLVAGAYDDNIDVIKLLISYGADINAIDNEGETAIDYAQESLNSDKAEVIQLLQEEASKIKN